MAEYADIFKTLNEGVESIFGVIGNVADGATSILGDYLEYESLWNEQSNQAGGQSQQSSWSWGQPTVSDTPPVTQTVSSSNSKLLMYGAMGLGGIALLSVVMGK